MVTTNRLSFLEILSWLELVMLSLHKLLALLALVLSLLPVVLVIITILLLSTWVGVSVVVVLPIVGIFQAALQLFLPSLSLVLALALASVLSSLPCVLVSIQVFILRQRHLL